MSNTPVIVEKLLDAPVTQVWEAITDKAKMKIWYFEFQNYEPVIGCEFYFIAGDANKSYKHLCKITELEPGKKITYSWSYEGYTGESFVSFELFDLGNQTKLVLTHTGLETFPANAPELARESFAAGWNHIINIALPAFLIQ